MLKSMWSKLRRKSELAANKINNSWYHYNSDSDTVIVFVHGFLSNSESCWTSPSGQFWPDIVLKDSRFDSPSIFLAGYHTAYDSGDYKLRDCAEEAIRALERSHADGSPSPMSFNNILFVCHSFGGVVTRYVLEAHTEKFSSKTVGLALMASPSIGSEYANSFSDIISFYRNGVGKQLEHMNETLSELDNRFKALVEDKKISKLVGAEAVEHQPLIRAFLIFGMKPVVTKESAARYFAHHQVLANTNHSSIVKPIGNNEPGHLFLYDFYSKKFKQLVQVKNKSSVRLLKNDVVQNNLTATALMNQVLFDIYSPSCSEYYAIRSIDKDISNALSMCSIWLSGPSGIGKTTAIRHYLYNGGYQPIEVCLSSCRGKIEQDHLIAEILATAYQRYGIETNSFKPSLAVLANLLGQHSKQNPIILYLDEVPISEDDSNAMEVFSSMISSLLDTTKRSGGNTEVRFVISSIAAPSAASGNRGKFAEHIRTLRLFLWEKDELEQLLSTILNHVEINGFEINEKEMLLQAAGGSPRFLKTYLRNRLTYQQYSPAEILNMTKTQYVS